MLAQCLKYLEDLKSQISVQTLDKHILRIERTRKTPFIYLDYGQGLLVISGRSIPENSIAFYKPVVLFLRDHFEEKQNIKAFVRIEYGNSSSSKCLLDIMKTLENYHRLGKDVEVFWYQEEDGPCQYSDGRDYQSIIRMPIHVFELDDDDMDDVDRFLAQLI